MTTKEIAEVAGVSVDTVQRKGRELFPGKYSQGKRVVFIKDEAVALMKELRKKNFVELPQNAEVLPQNADVSYLSAKDIALISQIVSATVAETIKRLDGRMEKIETRIDQRAALLPAPQIKPRDNINKIVRDWVGKTGGDHREAWNSLYRDFGYRTNTNPSICAKNRGMTILDYIEAEGQIDVLEAVAIEIYGGAK
jgi:hypothetical protein